MLQVHGQPPVSNLSWRYTYVTTNSAENAALSQHIMLAMVANQVTAYYSKYAQVPTTQRQKSTSW
jgi:hypothetical protein